VKTVAPTWNMFEKQMVLGEGAFGTVYRVKALVSSIIPQDDSSG
jgi:serine/threonine protein kinase